MSRYPRPVRNARIKCISCNAPVIETVDETYYCVDCGSSPIRPDSAEPEADTGVDTEPEAGAEAEAGD